MALERSSSAHTADFTEGQYRSIRDCGATLRLGGHRSILGGHKTPFLTNSLKFLKYWGAPPCSAIPEYDCLCYEFSKDLCKNKYTTMNCCRNAADNFDMSPEARRCWKKVKDTSPFFLGDHSEYMETSWSLRLFGITRIAEPIFQQFWRSQQLYETWLKEQWGKWRRTSTPNA